MAVEACLFHDLQTLISIRSRRRAAVCLTDDIFFCALGADDYILKSIAAPADILGKAAVAVLEHVANRVSRLHILAEPQARRLFPPISGEWQVASVWRATYIRMPRRMSA